MRRLHSAISQFTAVNPIWKPIDLGQLMANANGATEALSFSTIKSTSVLTSRLSNFRVLLAIAGAGQEVAFVSAGLSLRKGRVTRAKVYAADLTELKRFSLIKPARDLAIKTPSMTVQSSATEIDGKPGWSVLVMISQ